MFDEERFESLPHGEERFGYLKKCIAEADNEKNIKDMLDLRYEYIHEAFFYDDEFMGMVMFPEYMKLFDENPGVIEASKFMFPFKWVVENCSDYYQVSLDQIERYFERFEQYIQKFHYTMRTYYLKKYKVYRDIDEKTALEAYDQFDKYKRTDLSDCAACEASERAKKLIHFGDIETAVKMLNKMISDNMSCAEVPQVTYGAFAYEFAKRGMYTEAEHYAELMLPMVKGNETNFMREIAYVISLKANTDPECAYILFCECAGNYSRMKTPAHRFYFAAAAYRVFSRLESMGVKQIHPRISPDFELFDSSGIYDVTLLKDYFYNAASDIAKKFDERNSNTVYSDELEFVFPEAPECEFDLPLHGSITPENGGMGILYRSRDEAPSYENIGDTVKDALGLAEVKVAVDDDKAYITFFGEKQERFLYRAVYTDAPDMRERYPHHMERGIFGNIEEYTVLLLLISDNVRLDRYEDMRMLFKAADALNTAGSSIVFSYPVDKWHWSQWLKYAALSDAPPEAENMINLYHITDPDEPDKAALVTAGLPYFGSRDFIVRGVTEENNRFVTMLLLRLCEAVSFSPLPDEGIAMNSGITYDNRSYIRMKWRAVRLPEDETVYAEPLLLLTSRERRGRRLTELDEYDRNKMVPKMHRRASEFADTRSRNLYPYARKYFNTHDCKLTVGMNYTVTVNGYESAVCPDVELQKGGETGVVVKTWSSDLKVGTVVYVEPEDVYWFCIEEDGEKYEADDLWTLFED